MSGAIGNWFVNRDGVQHGPVSSIEMAKLVELGHLRRQDYVWRPGFDDWKTAGEVQDLLPAPLIEPPPFRPELTKKLDTIVPRVDQLSSPPRQRLGKIIGFRDPRRLTYTLETILSASVIIFFASLVSDYMQYELLSELNVNNSLSMSARSTMAAANDSRQGIIAALQLCALGLTIIVFCMWSHRANFNARVLGAEGMVYSPGWSVGWYFIPFANLVQPYKAMKEIWRASKSPASWTSERPPAILLLWWLSFLVSGAFANAALRTSNKNSSIDALITSTSLSMTSDIIIIPSTIWLLLLVRQIHHNQMWSYAQQDEP